MRHNPVEGSNLTANFGDMRLGRTRSTPEHHARALKLSDFVTDDLPDLSGEPFDYLAPMSSIPMLGNDVWGDCVIAAWMHLAQSVTAVMGSERVFTTDEAADVYGAITGFRKDDPLTDNGTNMFTAATWVRRNGLFGIEIEGIVTAQPTDWKRLHTFMRLFGGALFGVDLPLVSKRQQIWRLELGAGDAQIEKGKWGPHCVAGHARGLDAYGHPLIKASNWGGVTPIESTYTPYIDEVIIPLFKGWTPPSVPGFDRDRLLAAMRAELI